MAVTGISMVLYGLTQRVLVAPSIFWLKENTGPSFFGGFRYHGNAGAFLNLIWPLLLLFVIQSFLSPKAYIARAVWCSAFFLALVGCAANISRAAETITVFLVLVGAIWLPLLIRRKAFLLSLWSVAVTGGIVLIFVGALLFGGIAEQSEGHWSKLPDQLTDNQRLLCYQACWRTLPDSGWWGYGAGTFSAIFPDHEAYLGSRIHGFWKYAHEDYLQTLIEYGYVGACFWGVFFFGSIGRALVLASWSSLRTKERLGYATCVLALGGTALHSGVDFPLQIASLQLYVMMFIAMAWARPVEEVAPDTSSRRAKGKDGSFTARKAKTIQL
jgi:hypothetical protein